MRALGYVLGACIVLAAAQAAAAALIIGVVLVVLVGALTRPRETLSLSGFLLIGSVLRSHPLAVLSTVALMSIASIMIRSR